MQALEQTSTQKAGSLVKPFTALLGIAHQQAEKHLGVGVIGRNLNRLQRDHANAWVFQLTRDQLGQIALDLLDRQDDFDLLLCDLMMPGLTGMDVYTALAARGSRHVGSMLFLTGGAFVGQAGSFLATIPNRCLEKPFFAAELRDAVANAIAA